MPQVNYETKIENVVKESANVDLNKLNVHIPGTLPKQIVEKHIEYDPTFSEAFLYRFTNLLNGKIYLIQGEYDEAAISVAKHFTNKLYILPNSIIKEDKFNCVFSHWPLAEWPGKNKGIFHLHGHSLNKMKTDLDLMKRVNICTDNWNFTPQPINGTLEMLKNFKKKQQNTLGSEEL